jgi:hypothetical protein
MQARDKGGLAWVSMQILRDSAQERRAPRVPSPLLGRFRAGSTTEVVFLWLSERQRSRVWWSRDSIVSGTGRPQKAVDWALLFLRSIYAVEVTSDPRCMRYHRYRLKPGAKPSAFRHEA